MKKPLLSVIIPAYNSDKFLPDAIMSVIDQTYKNWELIIIDDGSTDNTKTEAINFQSDTRIKVFRQQNQGPAAARNRGIKEAAGDNLSFLDADDIWDSNKLDLQYQASAFHNDTISLTSIIRFYVDKNGNKKYFNLTEPPVYINPQDYQKKIISLENLHMANFCSAIIPKQAIQDVGGYDETLTTAEDWDLWIRLASLNKYKFVNINKPLVCYRKYPNSLTRRYQSIKTFNNQLKVLGKIATEDTSIKQKIDISTINKYNYFIKISVHNHYFKDALTIFQYSIKNISLFIKLKKVGLLFSWFLLISVTFLRSKIH